MKILEASGASITGEQLLKEKKYFVKDYIKSPYPADITAAINEAISQASKTGGTVVFTKGEYKTYTIRLKSNVNIFIEKDAVIRAAATEVKDFYFSQDGEGGNYDEPEVNIYAGLQDHGHTYFANSLFYGHDIENIMIYGDGLIDGSALNEKDGYMEYILQGGDPDMCDRRSQRGHKGMWFGNKAIALVRCKNVVLKDFSLVIGGHFAIITEGVENMLVDSVLVDTTRDALDIDCCVDVTVRNSVFNSLTDDALVIKSSYGAQKFMPSENILVEDCTVSGYDAKSVYAKEYTCDKLVAEDRCGPTGRVKLGTESTCGYDRVTIRRVKFKRSRGFALEAVDGSPLSNIIFTDCTMENVSSSPIFIRTGDRCRFPVTKENGDDLIYDSNTIRLDNPEFVIPDREGYNKYPPVRFVPSYNRSKRVSADSLQYFNIVNEENPSIINTCNDKYIKNGENPAKYGNAMGSEIAKIYNIEISNISVKDADPRYPILIAGLCDSSIDNVIIKNIDVTYRGGLDMSDAADQRQINTAYSYSQYKTRPKTQIIPWMVNTFFCKNEGLLPRYDYNEADGSWTPSPYNVPELPASYPEPSIFGILPAYGMYIRHAKNIELENINIRYMIEDKRHAVVLDDVDNISIKNMACDCTYNIEEIALIENNYKRHTNYEYILNEPYFKTTVNNISTDKNYSMKHVLVNAPAPGTPKDSLYNKCTCAVSENGFKYNTETENLSLPYTVIRPYFIPVKTETINAGNNFETIIKYRDPASETIKNPASLKIYNESVTDKEYVVMGKQRDISVKLLNNNSDAASYNPETKIFTFTPEEQDRGINEFIFEGDDGILKFYLSVMINVI